MTDEVTATETTTQQPTSDTPSSDAPAATSASTETTATEAVTDTTALGTGLEAEVTTEGEAEAEAPVGAPEKYELALEGVDLDPELVAEAEPILRELNLTNEQANALLPIAPKIMEKAQNATMQALLDAGAAQRTAWLNEMKADPEIGGNKFDETIHVAAKALDTMGFTKTGHGEDGKEPHPFRKALDESGFGNHPDMARILRRLGEAVGEDGMFVRSDAGGREDLPAWKVMYPEDK